MAAIEGTPALLGRREPGWIYKASWDLPLIIFSALLVPLPLLIAWLAQRTGWLDAGKTVDLINITVALLIGGPHLFSTITFTFLDGRFRFFFSRPRFPGDQSRRRLRFNGGSRLPHQGTEKSPWKMMANDGILACIKELKTAIAAGLGRSRVRLRHWLSPSARQGSSTTWTVRPSPIWLA